MFSSAFSKALPQHAALRTIALMRTVALSCLSLLLLISTLLLDIHVHAGPLYAAIASLAVFNAWTWQRMRQARAVTDDEMFLQLLIDISALSAMLYFSGGATNPFVSFYLPALAVAAATLPWRYALLLSILAISAYSLLTTFFEPIQLGNADRAISYHLAGMWANFSVSAALITWFVAGLSHIVRQRDAQLAQAREHYLENDRLIALGIQAANTAHEMGTPLSTVAIIASDLLQESELSKSASVLAPYRDEFSTIEKQIGLCKAALDRMGRHGTSHEAPGGLNSASKWLQQFSNEWRLRYPAIRFELLLPTGDANIVGSISLAQILTTLLDNAAQAVENGDKMVRLQLQIEFGQASIGVIDEGPGIAPDLLARLGFEPVSQSATGRGIGLFLAFATARQINASVALTCPASGGTLATVKIPII